MRGESKTPEAGAGGAGGAGGDGELLARFRLGDASAFEELVVKYQDRIYNLALRMTGDPAEAEDAAQDIFLRAYRALRGFRGGSEFYTWLYRIAVNTCISGVRRRKHIVRASIDSPLSEASEETPASQAPGAGRSPEEELIAREREDAVRGAIEALSPDYRAVVLLRDMEGLDYDGVARALGISRGAVKSRLHRARLELAARLRRLVS